MGNKLNNDSEAVSTRQLVATVCELVREDIVSLKTDLKAFEPSEGHTDYSRGMVEGGQAALEGVERLLSERVKEFGGAIDL